MKKKLIIGTVSLVATFLFAGTALAIIIVPPPSDFPTDTSDCKKGGWESYDGLFKNQGDCESYVVTEGNNEPSGPNA